MCCCYCERTWGGLVVGKCYHVSTWGGRLRVGLDNPAVLWDSYVLVQCSLVLPMRGGSPLTPGGLVTALLLL